VYSHSEGCSVTGGVVFQGRYYFGDYCSGTIWSYAGGRARAVGKVPAPSSFGIGGDGKLYVTSLNGALYVLR
jgi:hypothetical protein